MNRTPVKSSNISSIGYDPSENILEIEFSTGSVYQYLAVPSSVHESFMRASSKGSFFASKIRNKYRTRQIT
jgi:hypothetical protein